MYRNQCQIPLEWKKKYIEDYSPKSAHSALSQETN